MLLLQWSRGQRHGQGTMAYGNGSVYKGDWQMGARTGAGVFISTDKFSTYTGTRFTGSPNGAVAALVWLCAGDFVNGERHGWGHQLSADKSVYVGGWSRDERSGYGRCVRCNVGDMCSFV